MRKLRLPPEWSKWVTVKYVDAKQPIISFTLQINMRNTGCRIRHVLTENQFAFIVSFLVPWVSLKI